MLTKKDTPPELHPLINKIESLCIEVVSLGMAAGALQYGTRANAALNSMVLMRDSACAELETYGYKVVYFCDWLCPTPNANSLHFIFEKAAV